MDHRSWFKWRRREGSACVGVRLVIPYTISWVHVRACATRRRKQKTCATPYQSRATRVIEFGRSPQQPLFQPSVSFGTAGAVTPIKTITRGFAKKEGQVLI